MDDKIIKSGDGQGLPVAVIVSEIKEYLKDELGFDYENLKVEIDDIRGILVETDRFEVCFNQNGQCNEYQPFFKFRSFDKDYLDDCDLENLNKLYGKMNDINNIILNHHLPVKDIEKIIEKEIEDFLKHKIYSCHYEGIDGVYVSCDASIKGISVKVGISIYINNFYFHFTYIFQALNCLVCDEEDEDLEYFGKVYTWVKNDVLELKSKLDYIVEDHLKNKLIEKPLF